MGTKRPSYPKFQLPKWIHGTWIAYARGLADGRLTTPSVVDEEGHHGLEDLPWIQFVELKKGKDVKMANLCTIYIYLFIYIYTYV